MVFLCTINIALSCRIYLRENDYKALLLLLIAALLLLMISLVKDRRYALFKILTIAVILYNVCLVLYEIVYSLGLAEVLFSVEGLRKIILASKTWGIPIYFFITILQVVVLPIPAAVTVVLGSVIFGQWIAFIVTVVGTIIGSFLCYLIGSRFGFKAVSWIVGEEKAKKTASIVGKNAKIPFVLMILFPFFPDDVLCMAAGMSRMSFGFFAISVCVCRSIVTAFICFLGTGSIIPFEGWGIPVWISIFVVLLFMAYLIDFCVNKKKNRNDD